MGDQRGLAAPSRRVGRVDGTLPMMRWDLEDVATVTGGRLVGESVQISGVSIDSRDIATPMLFVPIVAERDGHDFIPGAIAAGAAAVLTSGPAAAVPHVVVDDTTVALQRLGAHARSRLPDAVVGITGSVGKTTTKDLLAQVLAADRPTHASVRSFNNELGVPLTLVNAPEGTQAAVVEMGARGIGHIRQLCEIAAPSIGVVLTVGAAHTELFGDLDGVARAKGELVESLPASGTAVLNAGDPRVMTMTRRTSARVVTFGAGGDISATAIELDDALRPSFELRTPMGHTPVRLRAAGMHSVTNACAAAAAAVALGLDVATIATGLEAANISPWRMSVERTSSGAVVINDAYNANPLSMHAAIDALLAVRATRRVAVVGPMAELGAEGPAEHQRVGERLATAGVEIIGFQVPAYGGTTVASIEEAAAALGTLGPDTVVLIKASRVAGLEQLAERLAADHHD